MSWGRRRNDYWGGWPRYVPVAERKEKARKQAEKLRKKGDSRAPVVIAGRTIAATFWGKAWCQNLEQYGDYENRIPRGRAYVRNGSVLDLKIGTARVDALVSGTHLYSVAIEIRPLKSQVWNGTKRACTGRIGSLLELLQGKLSREVMEVVTHPQTGLFPEPAEISFRCSCPDWANPCKHIAAVYYLLGERFDEDPFLLFELRGRSKEQVIAGLRERRAAEAGAAPTPHFAEAAEAVEAPSLAECLDHYWAMGEQAANIIFNVTYPRPSFALLKRVGIPAFQGLNSNNFQRQMERVYDGVTLGAMMAAFADSAAPDEAEGEG